MGCFRVEHQFSHEHNAALMRQEDRTILEQAALALARCTGDAPALASNVSRMSASLVAASAGIESATASGKLSASPATKRDDGILALAAIKLDTLGMIDTRCTQCNNRVKVGGKQVAAAERLHTRSCHIELASILRHCITRH